MSNYYQGFIASPYHISVGAVLRNQDGDIACHYFGQTQLYADAYILMRETMEPGETIEATLHRGLLEEFGAKAAVADYLGSRLTTFTIKGTPIQKTTLYFLCDIMEIHDDWRRAGDAEAESMVQWHPAAALIEKMQAQRERLGTDDLDESEILLRLRSPG